MKKALLFSNVMTYLICLLFYSNSYAQSQNLGGGNTASVTADMPGISPPSPTVSGLMKFEEVPVNNYTGIPDISIPLFKTETLSKDISVNLGLKYHPSSIAVKEVAAYTGLGWSLVGGGTISRIVKGLPDEIVRQGSVNSQIMPRIGIYNDNLPVNANYYYDVMDGFTDTPAEIAMSREFLWGAFEKGIFDSEHDLYQFNFMGHTGRFYIQKNMDTNLLEIVKLDNNNDLKIEFNYSYNYSEPQNKYNYIGFTVFDDKGYKYIFSDKETTTESVFSSSSGWAFGDAGSPNMADPLTYISSFHLSEIYAPNGVELVRITYQQDTESVEDRSFMLNMTRPVDVENTISDWYEDGFQVYGLLPKQVFSLKTKTTLTKKMRTIEIIKKAKIDFDLEIGREDSNINSNASKLKTITVKNWYNQLIKKFEFDYRYQYIGTINQDNVARLLLEEVNEVNTNTSTEEILQYKLIYKNVNAAVNYLREDYWGYLRRGGFGKETDPEYCTTGVLQQIILPTGGSKVFEFEPNTYSYIGDEALTEFDNSTSYTDDIFYFQGPGGSTVSNPLIIVKPDRNLSISLDPEFIPGEGQWYSAFRLINETTKESQSIDCIGMTGINDGSGTTEKITLKAGNEYSITFWHNDTTRIRNAKVTMRTFIPAEPDPIEAIYGGGVRIKNISYISGTGSSKVKKYNYHFFDNPNRTSGSLSFAKPKFEYIVSRNVHVSNPNVAVTSIGYTTTTSYNNLLNIRTQGSDVGYKNVTVWEEDNGKSEYTYTSPIDYPETYYTINYPFIPSSNFDYKRGLLTNENHYSENENGYKLLNEVLYDYPLEEMDEHTVYTGIRAYSAGGGCPMASNYTTINDFLYCLNNTACSLGWGYLCNPDWYLSYAKMYTSYGWPKLKTKVSKDYTYDDNDIANVVSTTETYEYNQQNKRISHATVSNSITQVVNDYLPETLTTTYEYDTDDGGINRIGEIKRIQTKRNNTILDTKEIEYNNIYLPKTVLVGKGELSPEPRLQFQMYDVFRNPLQVKPENGVPVSYIWGYNESLPVAVIENCEYSSINPTLITDVKQASNQNNEALLLTKLESLRAAVPNSMITTYTYKPLVGITTMTDPKGYKTTYEYDGFGRLIKVRDMEGNLLSENEYHYKTTNP